MLRVIRPGVIAALTAIILSVGGARAQQGCVEWSKAGPIIAQNSLLPANVIYQAVKKKTGGQIVNQSCAMWAAGFSISSSCSAPKAR